MVKLVKKTLLSTTTEHYSVVENRDLICKKGVKFVEEQWSPEVEFVRVMELTWHRTSYSVMALMERNGNFFLTEVFGLTSC